MTSALGVFSSEADIGSFEENVTKQKRRAFERSGWIGKCSGLCVIAMIGVYAAACSAPVRRVMVEPEPVQGNVATKRIAPDGPGNLRLPDGTQVALDASGGFQLPNGAYVRRDPSGALNLPNGARCLPDRSGGYLCP